MNIANEILEQFIKLNQLETDLINLDLLDFETKQEIKQQRNGLRQIQTLLKKILDNKYPNNNISTTYDMFEQYDFVIKVSKKKNLNI